MGWFPAAVEANLIYFGLSRPHRWSVPELLAVTARYEASTEPPLGPAGT